MEAAKEMSKILLTAIFKDDSEAEMIDRMLATFMPQCYKGVALITGVSGQFEKLQKVLSKYNIRYNIATPQSHPELYLKQDDKYIFGNFAAARNETFKLAEQEKDADWYLWADADDVLLNGHELQACADRAKELDMDSVFFTYWYSVVVDEQGNVKDVLIDHLRERLLKPRIFKWVSRLHEVAVPKDDSYKPKHTLYDLNQKEGRNLVWVHTAQRDRMESNLLRNIAILEAQAKEEEGKDPRTNFYLAKTYYDLGKPEDLAKAEKIILEDYIPKSGWDEEISNAWEYLGNIASRRGDKREAVVRYHNSIQVYPIRHMPYLLLAKEYSELGMSEHSKFWLDMVLKMEQPKSRTTIGNPLEIKLTAASLKYNDAIRENKIEDAIYWLKIRMTLVGEKENPMLTTLEDVKLMNEAAKNIFNYAKWLKDTGHLPELRKLLEALPLELGREPFAMMIANQVNEPKVWDSNSIVYFASWGSEHFEQWSGKSLSKGIGGSETAVIRLAEEWVKKGYKVYVYGDPRDDAGEINGVIYRPWYELNWNDEFNIFILWRSPHLLDRDIKAKKLFIDLHDMASALDYPEPRAKKIDKVFFKSEYHKKQIPQLAEKAVVISNGI